MVHFHSLFFTFSAFSCQTLMYGLFHFNGKIIFHNSVEYKLLSEHDRRRLTVYLCLLVRSFLIWRPLFRFSTSLCQRNQQWLQRTYFQGICWRCWYWNRKLKRAPHWQIERIVGVVSLKLDLPNIKMFHFIKFSIALTGKKQMCM